MRRHTRFNSCEDLTTSYKVVTGTTVLVVWSMRMLVAGVLMLIRIRMIVTLRLTVWMRVIVGFGVRVIRAV